jgi:DNA-binding transcriptional ArsR family regulator
MYNVLERLRSGEVLTAKEMIIHEQGLVSVLRQLHDELDAAVFDAYGWPHDLTDEQILERLVALNAERAAEERRGFVRWLRPDYQNPSGEQAATQTRRDESESDDAAADEADEAVAAAPRAARDARTAWPKEVPAQLSAIRALFTADQASRSADAVCEAFKGARRAAVEQHLESLTGLGLLVRYEASGTAHWHA